MVYEELPEAGRLIICLKEQGELDLLSLGRFQLIVQQVVDQVALSLLVSNNELMNFLHVRKRVPLKKYLRYTALPYRELLLFPSDRYKEAGLEGEFFREPPLKIFCYRVNFEPFEMELGFALSSFFLPSIAKDILRGLAGHVFCSLLNSGVEGLSLTSGQVREDETVAVQGKGILIEENLRVLQSLFGKKRTKKERVISIREAKGDAVREVSIRLG